MKGHRGIFKKWEVDSEVSGSVDLISKDDLKNVLNLLKKGAKLKS